MKKNKILMFFLLTVLAGLGMMLKYFDLELVLAQYAPPVENVTANVKVGGMLDEIVVYCNPVNFTLGSWGVNPGTSNNPKMRACEGREDIMIDLDVNNNVIWDLFMNATDMNDGLGHSISVNNIKINSTCDSTLMPLTTGLQSVCQNIPYDGSVNVSFYLDVDPGQYNSTYDGDLWIYVNSTEVELEPLNRTWEGLDNTTVLIERAIEIVWNGTPINFETVAPGSSAIASGDHGWPANITSTSVTNVFIELYLNGTDFTNQTEATPWNQFCSGTECIFESGNVTYSNATVEGAWPDGLLHLSKSFYYPPPTGIRGDFPNWGCNSTLCSGANLTFPNATTRNIWWNISIMPAQPAADYYATIWAKAADIGTFTP